MSRLLRVELSRLLARRAVIVILLAAVAATGVFAVGVMLNTRPPSGQQLAYAQQQVERDAQTKQVKRQMKRCVTHPKQQLGEPLPEDIEAACKEYFYPQIDWYVWYDKLDLAHERDEASGFALATVLAVLMLLVGTTFAGHDWASGSISNQLLFEPRRTRVWATKAIVVTVIAGVSTAILMSLYWLFLAALARSREYHLPRGLLLDCLQMGWRGAAVAGGAALAGYALTMFFRSTVAALGVLLAVGLAGGLVLAVIGVDSVWNPGLNLGAVLRDGITYYTDAPCPPGSDTLPGELCEVERTLSLARATTVLGTATLVVLVASIVSFRRRDVP